MGTMRIAGWVAALTVASVGVSVRADAQEVGCATRMIAGASAGALKMVAEGQADLKAGKPEDAFKLFQAAYCLYPDPNLKHGLSYAALALNRCDEAYDDAEHWSKHAVGEKRAEAKRWLSVVEGQCIAVAFRSEPPGATVRLDGSTTELGTTPRISRVHVGKHTASFTKKGYSAADKDFDLAAGARLAPVIVAARLNRLLGTAPTATTEDLPLDLPGPGPAVAAATPPPPAASASAAPANDELPPIPTPEEAAKPEPAAAPSVAPVATGVAPPAPPPEPVPPPHSIVAETPSPVTEPPPREAPLAPVVLNAAPPAEAPAHRGPPPAWLRPAAWTAIGVGAALLVVATTLGAVAHSQVTTLQSRAQPGESIQARLDGINSLGTGANALFVVGGVVAAAGVGVRVAF